MAKVKFNINGVIVEMEQEEVSKAIETGEVKIEGVKTVSDDDVVYSPEEFETFKTNLANDEYKKGRVDSADMLGKEIKKAGGFQFDNPKVILNPTGNVDFEKTSQEIIGKIKPEIESKLSVEPSKRIQELEGDLGKLRENYSALENDFTTYKSSIAERETRSKKDNVLSSFIPKTGLKVSGDITLLALKNQADIDVDFLEDGKPVITEAGNVVKDQKTLQPIDPAVFITEKLTKLDLIQKPSGGTGEEDGIDGKASGYDKFVKEMEAADISEGSQKFSIEMNKRIKEGSLKV